MVKNRLPALLVISSIDQRGPELLHLTQPFARVYGAHQVKMDGNAKTRASETISANQALRSSANLVSRTVFFGIPILGLLAVVSGAVWLFYPKPNRPSLAASRVANDGRPERPFRSDERTVPRFPPLRPVAFADRPMSSDTTGSDHSERLAPAIAIPNKIRHSGPPDRALAEKGSELIARFASDLPPTFAQKFVIGGVDCFRDGCLTEIEARDADMDLLREFKDWSEEPLGHWNGPVFRGAPIGRNGKVFLTWILLVNKEATK